MTAFDLTTWLRQRPNVTEAESVTVQIGRRKWAAAEYLEKLHDWQQRKLYVLGTLPPLHEKRLQICYQTDDSESAWHQVAWFRQKRSCKEWEEAHPFGDHFILILCSPIECWAIEQCEPKPYRRIEMTITPYDGPANSDARQDDSQQ